MAQRGNSGGLFASYMVLGRSSLPRSNLYIQSSHPRSPLWLPRITLLAPLVGVLRACVVPPLTPTRLALAGHTPVSLYPAFLYLPPGFALLPSPLMPPARGQRKRISFHTTPETEFSKQKQIFAIHGVTRARLTLPSGVKVTNGDW